MYRTHFGLKTYPFQGRPTSTEKAVTPERLSDGEIADYIESSLAAAGAEAQIFSKSAIQEICEHVGGDVNMVNFLCNIAMSKATHLGITRINRNLLDEAIQDYLDIIEQEEDSENRRRHPRKKVDLEGMYFYNPTKERGIVTLTNISLSGIQIKTRRQRVFRKDDQFVLSFDIPNAAKTNIRETMTVRNVLGLYVGAFFNAHPQNQAFDEWVRSLPSE